MNKANVEVDELSKSLTKCKPTANGCSSDSSPSSSDHSSSESETGDDESDDDEYLSNSQVTGLFSDKTFKNVNDLFRHEFEINKFNLVDVLKRNNMGMIDYIKMINYIRTEVCFFFYYNHGGL